MTWPHLHLLPYLPSYPTLTIMQIPHFLEHVLTLPTSWNKPLQGPPPRRLPLLGTTCLVLQSCNDSHSLTRQ